MKDWFYTSLSPKHLFTAGLLTIPALLFQRDTALLLIQAALFLLLAWFRGRKIKPLLIISFFAGITIIHLIAPYGRILFELGFIRITTGALNSGLQKAGLLIGLIYLSQFSVDSRIYFPGRLGGVIGRVFFYFERIMEFRGHISRKHPIADLDAVLFRIQEHPKPGREDSLPKTEPLGWFFLAGMVLINYAALTAGMLTEGAIKVGAL